MKCLAHTIKTLENSQYLQAHLIDANKLVADKLLLHGTRYSAELARHWWRTHYKNVGTVLDLNLPQDGGKFDERFEFVYSEEFRKQLSAMREFKSPTKLPALMRYAQHVPVLPEVNHTQLVCQYLCAPSFGLEQYYTLQRERKIWWMRASYNPSRFILEACESSIEHCQSVTIKSRLSFCEIALEHVSLVPLKKISLPENIKQQYLLHDKETGKEVLPTILRTVADLTLSTYALLFDACDHERKDLFMLHRKLAPFQCATAAITKGATETEMETLRELCLHINEVLRSFDIRCYTDWEYLNKSPEQFNKQIETANALGIPYVLLVNKESLETGLMKLRSRDTTLAETIHISDLLTYVPNIFTH